MYNFIQPQRKVARLTEAKLIQMLCNQLCVTPQMIKIVRLRDMPTRIKHACKHYGVLDIAIKRFNLPDGREVMYGFCAACGRLWFHVSSLV